LEMLDDDNNTDWQSWRLLPGPTILMPTLEFENRNANVTKPRRFGSAVCDAHAQFRRGPSFLRDADEDTSSGYYGRLTGTLFYTVQDESTLAASRLDIDLDALFGATRYRDKTLIPDQILHASSLAAGISNRNDSLLFLETPTLFTGTGRTGTEFLCKMFQAVGVNISHDNSKDCGPYPGTDGKYTCSMCAPLFACRCVTLLHTCLLLLSDVHMLMHSSLQGLLLGMMLF
jgi:hypothetical protein